MKRKRKGDHVVIGGGVGYIAICLHCWDRLKIHLPSGIGTFTGAMNGFVEDHKNCTPRPAPEITRHNWALSHDTGVSSATLWTILGPNARLYDTFDTPKDGADLGRCMRLLDLAPEWKGRLYEVAEREPKWRPFVENWTELEILYERALKDETGIGADKVLYDRIRQLNGETK